MASEENKYFNNLFERDYKNLLYRVNNLKRLERGTLDYWTYYEMCIVQIRAMFIETENRSQNHTLQNFLKSIKQNEKVSQIDKILCSNIIENKSLRECIKLSVDKFVVHYDEVTDKELELENEFRNYFTDLNSEYSIYKVIYNFSAILKISINEVGAN